MGMDTKIKLIACVSLNGGLGYKGKLLYRIGADLAHFRNLTTGCTIVMGRKTFASIGKPLPNRRNVIVTRYTDSTLAKRKDVECMSLEDALKCDKEIWVIGGGEIYKAVIDKADELYLTVVHDFAVNCDTFFPQFSGFKLVHSIKGYDKGLNYSFCYLKKDN